MCTQNSKITIVEIFSYFKYVNLPFRREIKSQKSDERIMIIKGKKAYNISLKKKGLISMSFIKQSNEKIEDEAEPILS